MSDERRELIKALAVASYHPELGIFGWIDTSTIAADALLAALNAGKRIIDQARNGCEHDLKNQGSTLLWAGSTPDIHANTSRYYCAKCGERFDLPTASAD